MINYESISVFKSEQNGNITKSNKEQKESKLHKWKKITKKDQIKREQITK